MRKEFKVKEWFIDKEQDKASRYNIFIDYARRTDDVCRQPVREDGCVYVLADEILGESEKALHITLASGEVLGSTKGWTLWIPKSVVMN